MLTHSGFYQLIWDVQNQYVKYRLSAKNRETAINFIFNDYAQELQSDDEKVAVLIGLSLSLCRTKELTPSVADLTISEIERIDLHCGEDNFNADYLKKVVDMLSEESVYGDESLYETRAVHTPDWKIGDLFSHKLSYPSAEAIGIMGWFILLYKVGEYVDEFGIYHHLMCISVCALDTFLPDNGSASKLDFLPTMLLGSKQEYLAQIAIKSKKEEDSLGLTKIGNFPHIIIPQSCSAENPLTAMPLMGRARKGEMWPGYEDQICRLYKKFGKRT